MTVKIDEVFQYGGVEHLLLILIDDSPFQVRNSYSNIDELASSVEKVGLLTPIIVRQKDDGRYEIICGHRRVRACRKLKMKTIPSIIRALDDENVVWVQGIENIQRNSYSIIEEGRYYKQLYERGILIKEIVETIGKSEEYIRDRIDFLDLPEDIQKKIDNDKISYRMARALTPLTRADRGLVIPGGGKVPAKRIENNFNKIREIVNLIEDKQLSSSKEIVEIVKKIKNGLSTKDVILEIKEENNQSTNSEIERMKPREFGRYLADKMKDDIVAMSEEINSNNDAEKIVINRIQTKLIQTWLSKGTVFCLSNPDAALVWDCGITLDESLRQLEDV